MLGIVGKISITLRMSSRTLSDSNDPQILLEALGDAHFGHQSPRFSRMRATKPGDIGGETPLLDIALAASENEFHLRFVASVFTGLLELSIEYLFGAERVERRCRSR